MMNSKLKAIADKAADDLRALVEESEVKILEAWDKVTEEAQDNETAPKFKLGLAITLDLDADSMETTLSWAVRHKVSANSSIPDPSHGQLDMGEKPTVTIRTGDTETTVTQEQLAKAAKRVGRAAKG